jgi:hypothetical protein
MKLDNVKLRITKEMLFAKFSQEQIMEFYFGQPIKLKEKYKNPFRNDKFATCPFFYKQNGQLVFMDFSVGKPLTCIDIAELRHGSSVGYQDIYYEMSNLKISDLPTPTIEFNKEDGTVEKRQGEFSVQLDKKGEYSYYPYMDSFKYYNPYSGKLYNSSNFDYEYELTDTEGGNGSCSECGGRGRVECDSCDGDGTRECYECGGNGSVSCDDCDGNGTRECDNCDGSGDLECSSCDGDGEVDCDDCDGEGEIDGESCENCSGSGKKECSDCDGDGKKECYKCDGDGEIKCRNCDGDGSVECGDCDGSGERECGDCDGEGRHSCPECG